MGALVEAVEVATQRELERVVNGIYGDMTGFVGGHSRSGKALGAIHIEGGGMSYFIGGTGGEGTLHLYYLNEGNGGEWAIITSTRATDRRGRRPGKLYLANGRQKMYAPRVHGYGGEHFVERIADSYGG